LTGTGKVVWRQGRLAGYSSTRSLLSYS